MKFEDLTPQQQTSILLYAKWYLQQHMMEEETILAEDYQLIKNLLINL